MAYYDLNPIMRSGILASHRFLSLFERPGRVVLGLRAGLGCLDEDLPSRR